MIQETAEVAQEILDQVHQEQLRLLQLLAVLHLSINLMTGDQALELILKLPIQARQLVRVGDLH